MSRHIYQIDPCRREDVPAVACLHLKVHQDCTESAADVERYYNRVLFEIPWCDEEIPSLVARSGDGMVEGLLGVMTRRMVFDGKPIRVAIPHNFMIAPECRSSMAAIQLMRSFLDGPQDLVYGDGANDLSRKLCEALGATTSCLYSINWLSLLRPCYYALNKMEGKYAGLRMLAAPAGYLADSIAYRLRRKMIRSRSTERSRCSNMDIQTFLSHVKDFTRLIPLRPDYDTEDVEWMEKCFNGKPGKNRPTACEVLDDKGDRIGIYLYRLSSKKHMEVMLLLARDDSIALVFDHLLDLALDLGVASVEGRMAPQLLQRVSDNNCLLKQRSWAVLHARDQEILNVIHRGDAQLSVLDGEFVVTRQ